MQPSHHGNGGKAEKFVSSPETDITYNSQILQFLRSSLWNQWVFDYKIPIIANGNMSSFSFIVRG